MTEVISFPSLKLLTMDYSLENRDYFRDADFDMPDDPLRTSDVKDLGTPETRMTKEDVQRIVDRRYLSSAKVARWLVYNSDEGPTAEDYSNVIVQNPRTGVRVAVRLANIREAIFGSI